MIISKCELLYKINSFGSLLVSSIQVPRRKDISNYLREAIVAAHQSGKGIRPFPNYLESIIQQRERLFTLKTFETDANLSRSEHVSMFTSKSDCTMLRETIKNPEATSQTLQASVSMLNVHDSTVRKRLNKYGLFGKVAGESLFSLKQHGSTA